MATGGFGTAAESVRNPAIHGNDPQETPDGMRRGERQGPKETTSYHSKIYTTSENSKSPSRDVSPRLTSSILFLTGADDVVDRESIRTAYSNRRPKFPESKSKGVNVGNTKCGGGVSSPTRG